MNCRLSISAFLTIAVLVTNAGVGAADEVNLTLAGHFGGATHASAVSGEYAGASYR